MEAILICVLVLGATFLFSFGVIRLFLNDITTKERQLLNEISVLKREIAELEKRAQ